MAILVDNGKLMTARLPGECAACGGSVEPGDTIYFSRQIGSRHQRCVDSDSPAPADAERPAPRGVHADREPRARDGGAGGGADRERPRGGAYAEACDRDAARRELGEVIDLVIEALQRIRKLLT